MPKRGLDTSAIVAFVNREHTKYSAAVKILNESKSLAIAPQVVSEFLHVITDPKRFEFPLSMDESVSWIEKFLFSKEVEMVFPNARSVQFQLKWMKEMRLGRKRILDTQLGATYHIAGIQEIITDNVRDFESLGVFQVIKL